MVELARLEIRDRGIFMHLCLQSQYFFWVHTLPEGS